MMILKKSLAWLLLGTVLCAQAADSAPAAKAPANALTPAREAIESRQFDKAVELLLVADQKQSADWNNLMGYSLRKKPVPDLAEAEKFYKAALALDPKHRGALEYYGELLLMKNDLPGAEALLSRLDKACFFGCEEFQDLKKSIQQYKSKQ